MHEYSLAESIIDSVVQEGKARNAQQITRVELEIGAVSGIVAEALETALEILKNRTMLSNTELVIRTKEGIGECRSCKAHFKVHEIYELCPGCGTANPLILQGNEMKILFIDIEV